jgi:hypothetical protein
MNDLINVTRIYVYSNQVETSLIFQDLIIFVKTRCNGRVRANKWGISETSWKTMHSAQLVYLSHTARMLGSSSDAWASKTRDKLLRQEESQEHGTTCYHEIQIPDMFISFVPHCTSSTLVGVFIIVGPLMDCAYSDRRRTDIRLRVYNTWLTFKAETGLLQATLPVPVSTVNGTKLTTNVCITPYIYSNIADHSGRAIYV